MVTRDRQQTFTICLISSPANDLLAAFEEDDAVPREDIQHDFERIILGSRGRLSQWIIRTKIRFLDNAFFCFWSSTLPSKVEANPATPKTVFNIFKLSLNLPNLPKSITPLGLPYAFTSTPSVPSPLNHKSGASSPLPSANLPAVDDFE